MLAALLRAQDQEIHISGGRPVRRAPPLRYARPVPADDLAAWIDELRRRLEAGELDGKAFGYSAAGATIPA